MCVLFAEDFKQVEFLIEETFRDCVKYHVISGLPYTAQDITALDLLSWYDEHDEEYKSLVSYVEYAKRELKNNFLEA